MITKIKMKTNYGLAVTQDGHNVTMMFCFLLKSIAFALYICRYEPAYFDCPVSTSSYEPFAVSIVLDEPCITPLNILHLKSKVRIPPRKFTVCYAPLRFNVSFGQRLVNSIELNRILGADYFVFYNLSLNHISNKVLNYYSKQGLAEVIPWNINLNKTDIYYYGQMAAINDCMLRHRHTTDYIVIVDLDEFIIPKDKKCFTWNDIFEQLPVKSSYLFRHAEFRIDWESDIAGIITDPKERKVIDKYEIFVLKTFERKIDKHRPQRKSKTIVNPRMTNVAGIHYVYDHIEGSSYVVNPAIAAVQHYRNRSNNNKTYNSTTQTTAIKYKTQLIERVQNVWQDLREEENN